MVRGEPLTGAEAKALSIRSDFETAVRRATSTDKPNPTLQRFAQNPEFAAAFEAEFTKAYSRESLGERELAKRRAEKQGYLHPAVSTAGCVGRGAR